jgi:hypothetical protein
MPLRLFALALVAALPLALRADPPAVREAPFHGYAKAVELTRGPAKAVLCPQVGGRVLSFSVGGSEALWLDPAEKAWKPGQPPPSSAGRFDYGPELTVAPHPKAWAGEWAAVVKDGSATLTSPEGDPSGIRVAREFKLVPHGTTVGLLCKQTLTNAGAEVREVCHWGRSFSPGGGICVIPLGDRPSRFPSRYAMYEDGATINVRATDPNIRERVLIDNAEQLPYSFAGIAADAAAGGGTWQVRTERVNLDTADYTLDGCASRVAVERKSLADLFGTIGKGRGRFIRELERLADYTFAAVVVEAEWSTVVNTPPMHSRLDPKTVYRSVLAWQQRFPRVHWWFVPGREWGEVTTFRILERYLKEQAEQNFRKPLP